MDSKEKELEQIESIMAKTDFWNNSQKEIARYNQQSSLLRENIEQWNNFKNEMDDAKLLAQMACEEEDG